MTTSLPIVDPLPPPPPATVNIKTESESPTPLLAAAAKPMPEYASGLSPYEFKGKVDLKPIPDLPEILSQKVVQLANWIRESTYTVLHCGAGLSTAAGIPDFRGENGVWTREKKGLAPTQVKDLDRKSPTYGHMAIKTLAEQNLIQFVVSQNVDGLFLRAAMPRKYLAELHGNYFVDECDRCNRRYIRNRPSPTMCCRKTGERCPRSFDSMIDGGGYGYGGDGKPCRGSLRDTILDWEGQLPHEEITIAETHSAKAMLSICVGTSLHIEPANQLPLMVKRAHHHHGGKRSGGGKRSLPNSDNDRIDDNNNNDAKRQLCNIDANSHTVVVVPYNNGDDSKIDDKSTLTLPLPPPPPPPKKSQTKRRLVIINLSSTKYDTKADLIIRGYIDDVMRLLCNELHIKVEPFDSNTDLTTGSVDLIEWIR